MAGIAAFSSGPALHFGNFKPVAPTRRAWLSLVLTALTGGNTARAQAVFPSNEPVRAHLSTAKTGRIAVVGLGDSNQLFQGAGWDEGWTLALIGRYGTWGTGLRSLGEAGGQSSGMGTGCWVDPVGTTGPFQLWGAPRQLITYLDPSAGVLPNGYIFLPEGVEASVTSGHGLNAAGFSGLDLQDGLRLRVAYGRFPGQHSVIVNMRTPDGVLAQTEADTGGGWGVGMTVLDAPPGSHVPFIRCGFGSPGGVISGPIMGLYAQLEQPGRTTGAVFHTLYAGGGKSARDMAAALAQASMEQLSIYFSLVREPLGEQPRVVVRLNSGVNDRSEWQPSVGHGYLPGNSPVAFGDNMASIIARVRAVWVHNGWNSNELRFVITVSHALSAPDDPQLMAYRQAARTLARGDPGVVAVDLSVLAGGDELSGSGWYNAGGTDHYHLVAHGVDELSRRELAALVRRDCASLEDTDDSGSVDLKDLLNVLGSFGTWTTRGQNGDVNADAYVDTSDLIMILSAFGSATCNADY